MHPGTVARDLSRKFRAPFIFGFPVTRVSLHHGASHPFPCDHQHRKTGGASGLDSYVPVDQETDRFVGISFGIAPYSVYPSTSSSDESYTDDTGAGENDIEPQQPDRKDY